MSRVQKYLVSANSVPEYEFLRATEGVQLQVNKPVGNLVLASGPLLKPGYNLVRPTAEPQAATTHVTLPQSGFIPTRVGTFIDVFFNNTGAGGLQVNTVGDDRIRLANNTLATSTSIAANAKLRFIAESITNEGAVNAGMVWAAV
jgi:hypothetical protein